MPGAAVRAPACRTDRSGAGGAGRAVHRARGRERGDLQPADRDADLAICVDAGGRGQGWGLCHQWARGQLCAVSVGQLLGGGRVAAVRDGAVAAWAWLAGAVSVSIRVACSPGEAQVAVVDDGRLVDFFLWRPGAPDGVGDVHRGRVLASVPAMAGAFV